MRVGARIQIVLYRGRVMHTVRLLGWVQRYTISTLVRGMNHG